MNVRKRKAISPLIATLLLIAIAVAASVLTYSWVMSMVGSQSGQAQTQLRIDAINWNSATEINVTIRNTGSVAASIESVAMKLNKAGSSFNDITVTPATGNVKSLDIGIAKGFVFTVDTLDESTSYVVRATATTGFYYELVAVTPSAFTT